MHGCASRPKVEKKFPNEDPRAGTPAISVQKHVAERLHHLDHQETILIFGEQFKLAKVTVHRLVHRPIRAIYRHLVPRVIKCPTAQEAMQVEGDGFRQRRTFPGVLGAVDNCHIPVLPFLTTSAPSQTERHSTLLIYKGLWTPTFFSLTVLPDGLAVVMTHVCTETIPSIPEQVLTEHTSTSFPEVEIRLTLYTSRA